MSDDDRFNFTWGIPQLDGLGYVQVFLFMLRTYSRLGLTKAEFLCLVHLASYHYNSPAGRSRPEQANIATEMGYGDRKRISELVRSLEKKHMLRVTRYSGHPNEYNAAPFAQAAWGLYMHDLKAQETRAQKRPPGWAPESPPPGRKNAHEEEKEEQQEKEDHDTMSDAEAAAWLAESRTEGESTILNGDLGDLDDETKAAIASPAGAPKPEDPPPATWRDTFRRHMPSRVRYDHGFGADDVLSVVEHFSIGSQIVPPDHPKQIRQWHAGAVGALYNAWSQLKDRRLGHRDAMRAILWSIDLFFQEYSPLAFITATTPHSIVNSMSRLVLELQKIQAAYSLGATELPTPEQAQGYYTKGAPAPARTTKEPGAEQVVKMRQALHSGNGGENPLITARETK